MKKAISTIIISLVTAGVIASFANVIKLELLDQREKMHYENVLELKSDIKDIKKYLYTGEKQFLIETK